MPHSLVPQSDELWDWIVEMRGWHLPESRRTFDFPAPGVYPISVRKDHDALSERRFSALADWLEEQWASPDVQIDWLLDPSQIPSDPFTGY